jgi:hypothetical protein
MNNTSPDQDKGAESKLQKMLPQEKHKIFPLVIIAVIIAVIIVLVIISILNQQEDATQNGSAGAKDERTNSKKIKSAFQFTPANLQPLDQGIYEAWAHSDTLSATDSLGTFQINPKGQLLTADKSPIKDNILKSALAQEEISDFFITIEPDADTDEGPSPIKILEGKFINNSALIKFQAVNVLNANGQYLLATPTDGQNTNETSGIWFVHLSESGTTAFPALTLKQTTNGFVYQGWIEREGKFLSTGRFDRSDFLDSSALYGIKEGTDFGFPGEDFLANAPEDFTFPLNLADGKTNVFISVEPNIEGVDPTGEKPFQLRFLKATISQFAEPQKNYDLTLDILKFPLITITPIKI